MIVLLVSFVVATALTVLLVRSARWHSGRSGDRHFDKPQKIHGSPVPRVGGLAVYLGLAAASAVLVQSHHGEAGRMTVLLLACAVPAFVAGFIQDISEAITPRGRLLATVVSALLAMWILDAAIARTAIPGLDWVVQFGIGSAALTVLAVAGIANAVNIIDGLNGLATMCVMLVLAAIAYVAFQVGDATVATMALAGIGAVLGFFVWNYPAGVIFLGDGGAYFLGFYISELSLLLLGRNPEVSPLFPLLLCIYPVFETLFSIYRRRWLRARPPVLPDGIHLHSLVYRRVMRWAVGPRSARALRRGNNLTSPVLWLLCMASVVPAVLFWNRTPLIVACLTLFALIYVYLYWRIVRFRSPRWLRGIAARSRPAPLRDNSPT